MHLITRLWDWLRLPESVGCEEWLNVFQLKDLLADLGSLVLLHFLGNFFEGVLESYIALVVAICETISKLLRILSWHLDLLDVDFKEFLKVRLVWVHWYVVLGLVSQLGPGLFTTLHLDSVLGFLFKIVFVLSTEGGLGRDLLGLSKQLDLLALFSGLLGSFSVVRSLFDHYFICSVKINRSPSVHRHR